MKKIIGLISILFIVFLLITGFSSYATIKSNESKAFLDIDNHWASEYLIKLNEIGGIDGYPDGTIRPDENITRGEFLALTSKTMDLNVTSTLKANDHWATPYFEAALDYGVFIESEVSKDTWDEVITRYEMAKIIIRTLEQVFNEKSVPAEDMESKIQDYQAVQKSGLSYYVEQAFNRGIITGKNSEGMFAGLEDGTRAEAATMIIRLVDSLTIEESRMPTIIYPDSSSDLEIQAAKEIRRYIYIRTDELVKIQSNKNLPTEGDIILVSNDSNPMVESLREQLNYKTSDNQIMIKTINENSRNILVITANTDERLLNAAYRFAEHLGIFFGLAEDVIPDKKIKLDITGYDEIGIPNFEITGIQPFHDFPSGPDLWSTEEYLHFITQLPKIGMNFIGIHTYPQYNSLWDKENGHNRGPEPSVWIGMEEDFNSETGEVTWSYPAYYAHSKRANWIWGFDIYDTGNYHAGARNLFPTNGWGSDVIGEKPPEVDDIVGFNKVFNKTGKMFNKAFTHAQNIGVKTALGTELPLGLEDDGFDRWIRGIPKQLQKRLIDRGKDPSDPNTVKELYKSIFKRIMATHPLDYYWLWSYEIWPGDNSKWVESYEKDISLAIEALEELGNPFKIAHAGWQLGSNENPAELENVFPSDAPFLSLMGSATGYEELSAERVKWPSTWLEYDRSLGQPELSVDRIHEDAYAALDIQAEGFIAENWRTRLMSPNIGAMKELSWTYSTSSQMLEKTVPSWPGDFIDEYYIKWATKMFGPEASQEIADIFLALEYDMPHPLEWAEEETGSYYMVPGAILPNPSDWSTEKNRYKFVTDFESLRNKIVGEGNLERFDYWLKAFQALKLKGQYGCVRYKFEEAIENGEWKVALDYRRTLARLWEDIMTFEVEKATNVSDLGDIMNLEVVNWKQLMINKHDEVMEEGLGNALPEDAYPSKDYSGQSFIKVLAPRSVVKEGESLGLKVIGMAVDNPVLKYRPFDEEQWSKISLKNIGRSVYEVTIPSQKRDFEYFIEAGDVKYPASSNNLQPTFNTVIIKGKEPNADSITKSKVLSSTWQPWEWKGYEKFPSLYFAAESEGYFSSKQMEKISQFSLAILEFRMGQFIEEFTTGKWAGGDLAKLMENQVEIFKDVYPDGPPMLVYRSGMWAGSMFKNQWKSLQNQNLFIKDDRECEGFINYPMNVDESGFETDLKYCRWDFRKEETQIEFKKIMKLAALENTDGVFFDNGQSVANDEANHLSEMTFDERKVFMYEQLKVYREVFNNLVENNKYPILSTTTGFSDIGGIVPWENSLPRTEEILIESLEGVPFARNNEFWMWNLGDIASKQIRNAIRETKEGSLLLFICHTFQNMVDVLKALD